MFGFANPWILLALAAGLAATGAGGFWAGKEWEQGAEAQRQVEAKEQADEKRRSDAKQIDTAAAGHEGDKTRIRTEFVTITQTVERIVREPFYAAPDAAACLDPAGLQALTDAIAGPRAAASQPARTVPQPRPPD